MSKKRRHTSIKVLNQYMEIDFSTTTDAKEAGKSIHACLRAEIPAHFSGPDGDEIVVSYYFLSISTIHITPPEEDLTTEE